MNIVVLDAYPLTDTNLSWECFERLGDVTIYEKPSHNEYETINRAQGAEIVIIAEQPISEAVINACPDMRYIGILGTGYNCVDVNAARCRGIPVVNVPCYGTAAVAQTAIAHLLEICNRVGDHADAIRGGAWSAKGAWSFWIHPLTELLDKTIGIIGFGRIGQNTARIAAALGMKVLAYSRSLGPAPENEFYTVASLDEIYKHSDVISLHCPLNDDSREMINERTLSLMKDGVIIINTARGALIDETALVAALNSGKVYAAGLDVTSVEPLPDSSPLLKAKNCFITPHLAWAPIETLARCMHIAAENLESYLSGKPVNVVNP